MSILPRIKLMLTVLYRRYFHPHRRFILVTVLLLVGVFCLAYGVSVLAATAPATTTAATGSSPWTLRLFAKILFAIARLFLSIALQILNFFMEILKAMA